MRLHSTALLLLTGCVVEDDRASPSPDEIRMSEELLGKMIFTDPNLSSPAGQSCASCHDPDAGFADPDRHLPTSEGVISGLFGNRNSPTVAYCSYSPPFGQDEEGLWVGGQFWDGRAATPSEQAAGPFQAALEMHNTKEGVVAAVMASDYADLFELVYGDEIFLDQELSFQRVTDAIAAFEASPEVNRFSSKYDAFLAGEATLSEQELWGLDLFNDEAKGNCAACHPSDATEDAPPLFTDYSFDNLGVPKNPDNPYYTLPVEYNPDGADAIDLGLGGYLGDPAEDGKFKVPTLRNVAKTAPYMHNGLFETLEETVRFYNTRDTDPAWGAPEVAENVNREELGDLGLTDEEIAAIVAFMETLTDGWHQE